MLNAALCASALIAALLLQPWRQLRGEGHALIHPLLGSVVFLTCAWGLPTWLHVPLNLQWSGACLVMLMLGWPLAVLVFGVVGIGLGGLTPMSVDEALATATWLGVVPATLALLIGHALRRFTPHHPFVYTLGRCFLGTVASLFIAGNLAQWLGADASGVATSDISRVARWLLAWGDGVITGMLGAIFVAFKPEWMATWSDRIYLQPSLAAAAEVKAAAAGAAMAPALDLLKRPDSPKTDLPPADEPTHAHDPSADAAPENPTTPPGA